MSDRRAHPRVSVNSPARLFFGSGLATWADCTIKDISDGGARLQVDAIYTLPNRLVLLDYQQGVVFEAVRRWRKWDLAGVAFELRHEAETLAEPKLAHVVDVWRALRGGLAPT